MGKIDYLKYLVLGAFGAAGVGLLGGFSIPAIASVTEYAIPVVGFTVGQAIYTAVGVAVGDLIYKSG